MSDVMLDESGIVTPIERLIEEMHNTAHDGRKTGVTAWAVEAWAVQIEMWLRQSASSQEPTRRPWCQICGVGLTGFYCDACRDALQGDTPTVPNE